MTQIQEFTRSPCPICGHRGWCGRREDGLVLCKRPPRPAEVAGYLFTGLAQDGQTGMYVEAGREHRRPAEASHDSYKENRQVQKIATPSPTLNEALGAAVAAFSSDRRAALAAELGLPESALGELAIGWSDKAQHHGDHSLAGAWIFQEYDGQGRLIGVTYRFPATLMVGKTDSAGKPLGTKSAPPGTKRGLTLPVGWRDLADPVLIVEGASDVLAGRAVGLSMIGRPSNTGGVDFLAQLCRHRQIIVLGENDRKADGRWPGQEGAKLVARRLETAWGRPAPVALPPGGFKDLRDWVTRLLAESPATAPSAIGQAILEQVKPVSVLLLAGPRDRRGSKVSVKAFRSTDPVGAAPIHADRLNIDDARARRRFAQTVADVEPKVSAESVAADLLALEVAADASRKAPVSGPTDSNLAAGATTGVSGDSVTANDMPSVVVSAKPRVFLPGGPVPILESSAQLGLLLAQTGKYFIRGGSLTTLGEDDDGQPILESVRPAALASVLELVADLWDKVQAKTGTEEIKCICGEQRAKLIEQAATFQAVMPPIRQLNRCPVLLERDGGLVQIAGYDRASAILAFGEPAPEVPLDEAVTLLSELLIDFRFATRADRARALAALVTPALVFGQLLKGRAPIDLGEADQSQTGKGYRNKLTAAIYRSTVRTVTQKKGGVGSLEETFNACLVRGVNFISLDNIRGSIDSPSIESFLTEDRYLARIPYQPPVEVDPRRVIVQMTSNKADITVNLANRSSCVRILKQPADYEFRRYSEGDLLDRVLAHQPRYLGAVFAVVRAWHQAGKPRTDEKRHDFRPWAQTLDWIVRQIFDAGALLDGHRETQARMAMPVLNWLRDVALAVRQADQLGLWLRASALIDIIADHSGIELPGLPEGADLTDDDARKKTLQAVGRKLSQCFGSTGERTIDGIRIARREAVDAEGRTVRDYLFAEETLAESSPYGQNAHSGRIGGNHPRLEGHRVAGAARSPANAAEQSQMDDSGAICPLCAPYEPPMRPAIEMAVSPMPAMGQGKVSYAGDDECTEGGGDYIECQNIGVIGTHSGIGGTEGNPAPAEIEEEALVI